jgi:ketosteroid isomerase-like protein
MSQENVEIVRKVYDAVARRDTDAVLTLYDPEVEWDFSRHPFRGLMGGDVSHGHEGLRRWFREWYEAWETLEDNLAELIDAGDKVISVVTTRGRGRASGVEVELTRHAGVWTIRDGKIVRVVWFRTRADALKAAGLSE